MISKPRWYEFKLRIWREEQERKRVPWGTEGGGGQLADGFISAYRVVEGFISEYQVVDGFISACHEELGKIDVRDSRSLLHCLCGEDNTDQQHRLEQRTTKGHKPAPPGPSGHFFYSFGPMGIGVEGQERSEETGDKAPDEDGRREIRRRGCL
jgi:hypothetical protein